MFCVYIYTYSECLRIKSSILLILKRPWLCSIYFDLDLSLQLVMFILFLYIHSVCLLTIKSCIPLTLKLHWLCHLNVSIGRKNITNQLGYVHIVLFMQYIHSVCPRAKSYIPSTWTRLPSSRSRCSSTCVPPCSCRSTVTRVTAGHPVLTSMNIITAAITMVTVILRERWEAIMIMLTMTTMVTVTR